MKKIKKIIPLFFFLMLVLNTTIMVLSDSPSMITKNIGSDETADEFDFGDRLVTVDSNGKFHTLYLTRLGANDYNVSYANSTDGDTWNNITTGIAAHGVVENRLGNIVIGANDSLYCTYYYAGDEPKVAKSMDGGLTWLEYTQTTVGDVVSTFLFMDTNDDLWLFTTENQAGSGGNLYFQKFNFDMKVWSNRQVLYTENNDGAYFRNVVELPNGTLMAITSIEDHSDSASDLCYFFVSSGGSVSSINYAVNADSSDRNIYRNQAVCDINGDVHVVYNQDMGATFDNYYVKYDYSSDTWSTPECIYNYTAKSQYYPTISVTSGGKIYVAWQGNNNLYTNALMMKYKTGDTWSDLQILSGATNLYRPRFLYQQYPTSCIATDGYALVYTNDTTDYHMFGTSDDLAWYGAGSGSGSNTSGTGQGLDSSWNVYCDSHWGTGLTHFVTSDHYAEVRALFPVTSTVRALDFYVAYPDSQASNVQTADWRMFIKGNTGITYLGAPDYVIPTGVEPSFSTQEFILRWSGLSIDLSGTNIIFELKKMDTPMYLSVRDTSSFFVNVIGLKTHDISNNYGNGIWDGTTSFGSLPKFCVYTEGVPHIDPATPSLVNSLYIDDDSVIVGEAINIVYASTFKTPGYVDVWRSSNRIERYSIPAYNGTWSYIPTVAGTYDFVLNHTNANQTTPASCTVTVRNEANYIFTNPNPSVSGDSWNTTVHYTNSEGVQGRIFYSTDPTFPTADTTITPLFGNGTHYFQDYVLFSASSCVYYRLTVGKNNTPIYSYTHHITHNREPSLRAVYPVVKFALHEEDFMEGYGKQSLNYKFDIFGFEVSLWDGNKFLTTLDNCDTSGFYDYYVENNGLHTVFLKVKVNDGTYKKLAEANFEAVGMGEEIDNSFHMPAVESTIGYIFAFGLIIGSLLAPMLLSFYFGYEPSGMPGLVYALCGAVGVVISVLLGFIPSWVPFFIVAVALFVTILLWINNRS